MSAKPPSYSVPALEKGLDILEALAASPSPLSLAELARDLERGSAEIFRMLVCLERRAYLRRDPVSGKYAPTLRLFELGQAHPPLRTLLEAARDPMREVTAKLGESCHLSVIERGKLEVVAREDSPETVRLFIEVGGRFDPRKTASGRLLLDSALTSVTARDETIEGVDDVAVRIGSPGGAVHAALAVSWLRSRKGARKPSTVLAALKTAAASIHQTLGIHP
ncbi:MAG: helix-turn-helix domain-containing protein [Verrucomicrobiae bacterium]|nr:helix-turn-helix domain-containing protein [Verrucomicrobiae bacterium]